MRKALLLGFVMVACSKDPPAQTPVDTTASAVPSAATSAIAPPTSATATTPVASASATPTKAPDATVSFQEQTTGASVDQWTLVTKGLPAISEDGTRVVYVINEQDGMRGYPNHKIYVKLVATDAVDKTFAIFNANQLDKASRANKLDDERKKAVANVAAAREALGSTKWTPLVAGTGARGKAFTSGDLSIELTTALRFTATDKAGKKAIDLDAKGWKQKGSGPCAFTPTLDAVSVSPEKKIVAATIVHMVTGGGDSCNLSDEVHVVGWK